MNVLHARQVIIASDDLQCKLHIQLIWQQLSVPQNESPTATPLEAILVPATPVPTVPEGTAPAVLVSGMQCNVPIRTIIQYVPSPRVRYVQS